MERVPGPLLVRPPVPLIEPLKNKVDTAWATETAPPLPLSRIARSVAPSLRLVKLNVPVVPVAPRRTELPAPSGLLSPALATEGMEMAPFWTEIAPEKVLTRLRVCVPVPTLMKPPEPLITPSYVVLRLL